VEGDDQLITTSVDRGSEIIARENTSEETSSPVSNIHLVVDCVISDMQTVFVDF
jgi:hypothetical protein